MGVMGITAHKFFRQKGVENQDRGVRVLRVHAMLPKSGREG